MLKKILLATLLVTLTASFGTAAKKKTSATAAQQAVDPKATAVVKAADSLIKALQAQGLIDPADQGDYNLSLTRFGLTGGGYEIEIGALDSVTFEVEKQINCTAPYLAGTLQIDLNKAECEVLEVQKESLNEEQVVANGAKQVLEDLEEQRRSLKKACVASIAITYNKAEEEGAISPGAGCEIQYGWGSADGRIDYSNSFVELEDSEFDPQNLCFKVQSLVRQRVDVYGPVCKK